MLKKLRKLKKAFIFIFIFTLIVPAVSFADVEEPSDTLTEDQQLGLITELLNEVLRLKKKALGHSMTIASTTNMDEVIPRPFSPASAVPLYRTIHSGKKDQKMITFDASSITPTQYVYSIGDYLDEECCEGYSIKLQKYNKSLGRYETAVDDLINLENYLLFYKRYENKNSYASIGFGKIVDFMSMWSEDGRYIFIQTSPYESDSYGWIKYIDVQNRKVSSGSPGLYNVFDTISPDGDKIFGFDQDPYAAHSSEYISEIFVFNINDLSVSKVFTMDPDKVTVTTYKAGGMGESVFVRWLDNNNLEIYPLDKKRVEKEVCTAEPDANLPCSYQKFMDLKSETKPIIVPVP